MDGVVVGHAQKPVHHHEVRANVPTHLWPGTESFDSDGPTASESLLRMRLGQTSGANG